MNIVFVGGGSGGHFFPCIEFIKYCKLQDDNCFYIGALNKYEYKKKELVPCDTLFLEFHGFNNNLKSAIKLLKSYHNNKKEIKDYLLKNKIELAVLFGNFESLVVGLVCKKLKIPFYIHEQNSKLGRSNKLLINYTQKGFSFYKIKHPKIIRVGNPRQKKQFHLRKNNKILVILGSLGASKLIDTLIEILNNTKYNVTFVLGENVNKYKKCNHKIIKYFDHQIDSFNNYDFIITRGGATTLAEIVSYAIPFLVIPSPNVINNHQEENAINLIREASGEYISEKEVTKEKIITIIDKYLSDNHLYLNTQLKLYHFALNNPCERMYKIINEEYKSIFKK